MPQVFLHGDALVLEAIEHDLRADGVLAPPVIDALQVLVRAVRSRPAASADRVDGGETTGPSAEIPIK